MELRHLRYFVTVSEAGSLLRAAERLRVAQPSLGQQISALELELGAKLFERSSRGMSLTAAGKQLLEHARIILGDIERARQAMRDSDAAPHGNVVVGLPTTVALAVTVPLVAACRERFPQVRLKVSEAYSGFLREWLQAGRLDMAILFGEAQEPMLAKRVLLDERLALITAGGGAAAPKRISLASVQRSELILPGREHGLRRIIDDACAVLGLELRVVAEVDSLSSVKKAVESGIAATILPLASVSAEVASGRLRASAITDQTMLRRVVVATNMTRPLTSAATAVIALSTDLIGQMVQSGTWPGRWLGPPAAATS